MDEPADRLVPVLVCGLAGGLLGSLSCCCWLGPAAAGFAGARWTGSAADGVGVGLVSGALVATAGTALFLATAGVHESAESLAQAGVSLDAGGLAAVFSLIGFGVSLAGAGLGGLVAGNRREEPPVLAHRAAVGEPPELVAPIEPTEPVQPIVEPSAAAPEPRTAPQEDADSSLDVEAGDLASAEEERDAWD